MMTYEEFADEIIRCVKDRAGEDIRVEKQTLLKNNGVTVTGILMKREGAPMAPLIHLKPFYERLLGGSKVEEIAEELLEFYRGCKIRAAWNYEEYLDFGKISSRVVFRLVSASRNELLLHQIPYLPFFDLAVVFYCLLEQDEEGTSSILIRNSHLSQWKIPISVLYEYAKHNTPRICRPVLKPLGDMLENLLPEEVKEEIPVLILTNESGVYGAAALIYDGILTDIYRQLDEAFYLLPSSVHEFLVIPESAAGEPAELRAMVREVNETQVSREELLSENVYFYNGASLSLHEEKRNNL